jgi:hypothetical protein
MIGHQAVGNDVKDFRNQVLAKLTKEVEVILQFEKDELVVVPAAIEVVVLSSLKWIPAIWHRISRDHHGPVPSERNGSVMA